MTRYKDVIQEQCDNFLDLRKLDFSVLVNVTSNTGETEYVGGFDQQFFNECNNRPHPGLAVPGFSPNEFEKRIRNRQPCMFELLMTNTET